MDIYPPAQVPTRAWSQEGFLPGAGAAVEILGLYNTVGLQAIGHHANISTWVPWDMTTLTNASLLVIPRATLAAAQYSIDAYFGSPGQAYTTHITGDAVSTYNVTQNIFFEIDLLAILALAVAGDAIGIRLTQRDAPSNVNAVLVRFRYD